MLTCKDENSRFAIGFIIGAALLCVPWVVLIAWATVELLGKVLP